MYTACVAVFYRGRRGPPYTLSHAEPFGSSRYESNLYIVKPPLDPVLIVAIVKGRVRVQCRAWSSVYRGESSSIHTLMSLWGINIGV